MAETHYDAVVIGAGVGGLFAAACLVNAGKSVLLIDDHDRVGGRATSYEVDGFIVNMGAIALEKGGVFEQLLNETGVELDVRELDPRHRIPRRRQDRQRRQGRARPAAGRVDQERGEDRREVRRRPTR